MAVSDGDVAAFAARQEDGNSCRRVRVAIVGFRTVFLRKKEGGRWWGGTRDGGEAKEEMRDVVKLIVCFVLDLTFTEGPNGLDIFLIVDYPQNSFYG